MKKQIVIVFLLSGFLFQCTNNKQVNISGTIKDIQVDNLYLLDNLGDTLATHYPVDSNRFDFKLNADKENYYTLSYDVKGKNSVELSLYLKPEESLSVIIDSLKVTFKGNGVKRNEYLYDKNNYNWYSHWIPFYEKIEQETFYRDSVTIVNRERVHTLTNDSKFIERELKYIDYDYAYFIFDRQMSDSNVLDDIKWAKSIETNNKKELRRSKDYIRLVAKQIAYGDSLSMKMMNRVHNIIEHKNLQNAFISEFIGIGTRSPLHKQLQTGMDDYKKAVVVKEFTEANYPHFTEHLDPIFNIYQKFYNAEGKTASFSYEDVDGNIVNLSDFKEKYVYIDFWATWCSWCIKEFPKLTELREQFKNKNIEFVSISIDFEERKGDWKDFVIKNKLGGFQLIAPLQKGKTSNHTGYVDKGEIEDAFLTLLHVNDYKIGIPQFSLIGPNGKVIDASAPRPSNENIIDYLNQYLK